MIYQANELLAKLRHLTLCGQADGELEFMGKIEDWREAEIDAEKILKDYYFEKQF